MSTVKMPPSQVGFQMEVTDLFLCFIKREIINFEIKTFTHVPCWTGNFEL